MRIRKNASKFLGSTSLYPASTAPQSCYTSPASWDSHASAASTGVLCELNRSPWDVILPPPLQEEEEEEEVRGIMGIEIKTEKKEPMNSTTVITSNVQVKETKEKKVKVKKKEKKEKEISSSSSTTNCKKSDGKGWKCKRQAHHPHSLCQYHLTQLRSYNSNNQSPKPHNSISKNSRRKAMAEGESSMYYYYAGFGPCRGGNRRGISSGCCTSTTTVGTKDEEEEEEEDCRESENGVFDNDEDDSSSDEDQSIRRRRRKPVKARSLKSLL